MTCSEVMDELKKMGDPNVKALFIKHGVKEPLFGVKIGQLKTIQKKVKKELSTRKRAVRHRECRCHVPCGTNRR